MAIVEPEFLVVFFVVLIGAQSGCQSLHSTARQIYKFLISIH